MHLAEVEIVADSISRHNKRITTFKLRYWRGVHAEVMTHRAFSRNAGSSRARPSQAIIDQVRNDPWGPLEWGVNKPGMQAEEEIKNIKEAQDCWRWAAQQAADAAQDLMDLGLHKQIVNRVLEPFTFIDVVVTATEFNNFFTLRIDEAADPTIFELAVKMKEAFDASTPKLLSSKDWHLPFILEDDYIIAQDFLKEGDLLPTKKQINELLIKISVARCARTSYKAFDGTTSPIEKDLELYDKLLSAAPLHASPAEHQACPDIGFGESGTVWAHKAEHGNFVGWRQFRKMLPNEYVPG